MLGCQSLDLSITTLIYMEVITILENQQVDLKFGVPIIITQSQVLTILITAPSAAITNIMLHLQVISSRKQWLTTTIRLGQILVQGSIVEVDSKLKEVLRRVALSVTLSISIICSIKTIAYIMCTIMDRVRTLQLYLLLNSLLDQLSLKVKWPIKHHISVVLVIVLRRIKTKMLYAMEALQA